MPLDSLTSLFVQATAIFSVVMLFACLLGEIVRWVFTDLFGRIVDDD